MRKDTDLKAKGEEIKKVAEAKGLSDNYFFTTTFDRYETQIKILEALKREIDASGPVVTKEYVKGRENVYTNPAIRDYNRTADSANATVACLIKIIKGFEDTKKTSADPLTDLINGSN